MNSLIEVEAVGGPRDGSIFLIDERTSLSFTSVDYAAGEITTDVYALAVNSDGRFTLKFLSTNTRPVA